MGLTPRTTRVSPTLFPYEATSFPAFDYYELLEETWEDSDLLRRIEYMLFLPLLRVLRGRPPRANAILEAPRFWRPSTHDLETVRREWELFRLEIEQGMADSLTPRPRHVSHLCNCTQPNLLTQDSGAELSATLSRKASGSIRTSWPR